MPFGKPKYRYTKYGKAKLNRVTPSVKKYVNKVVHSNIENKYFVTDMVTGYGSIPSAWVERDVCYPVQGDGISDRTGQQIKIRSIEIKGVIAQGSSESAVDDAYNVLRIVLALYNGQDFTPLGALATMNQPITTEFNTAGQMRKKYMDKYIALNVVSTEQGEGDGYVPQVKSFKYYKKFKRPVTIRFGDSGTVNQQNRIVLSMLSDSAGVPNPGFVAGYMKVLFEDA